MYFRDELKLHKSFSVILRMIIKISQRDKIQM